MAEEEIQRAKRCDMLKGWSRRSPRRTREETLTAEDKPTVAFALSIAGAALQTVAATGIGLLLTLLGGSFPRDWGLWWEGVSRMAWREWSIVILIWVALAAVILVLSFLGASWINSANPSRVKSGSTVVLVAALIAFPTLWGFGVGSLLMIVGAIIGLTWKPRSARERAAPVQPASPWEF